jgi:hypothetical protein
MTFARRVDTTHKAVMETLRKTGWQVLDTSRLRGFVDLVVWHPGRQALRLIEVKDRRGALTDAQRKLVDAGWPVTVLRSPEDAAKL